jgi:hypothetical protein
MIVRERVEPRGPVVRDDGRLTVASGRSWTALGTDLALLPFVALAELLLVRTFYRVGIYLPKDGPFRGVYETLTGVGSFALNLSSVLVVVALALLAATAYRNGHQSAAFALGAFLVASVVVRLAGVRVLGTTARFTFALAVVALTAPFLRSQGSALLRVLVGVVAACFLLSAYAGVVADVGRLVGAPPTGVVGAQLLAEALVVVAAAVAFGAWITTDGFRLRPALVAAPLAATLFVIWHANGAATGILVLWTVGLRLYLPMWLYAIALWAFLAATLGWLPRHPMRSGGLVLLLVAGMLLGSTYLESLGLVALALLSDGRAVGGLPASRAARHRFSERRSP